MFSCSMGPGMLDMFRKPTTMATCSSLALGVATGLREVQLTRDFLYVICPTSQVPLSLAVMCASAKHSPSNPAALPLA